MKRAIKHLKKAHSAALRGDHKAVMFHTGHVLAATRAAMQAPADPETDPNEAEPDTDQDDTTMGKNWIAGAIKKPGALHKQLGVPEGQKIPPAKLNAAAHSDNPTLAKRANLAKTLKKLRKK